MLLLNASILLALEQAVGRRTADRQISTEMFLQSLLEPRCLPKAEDLEKNEIPVAIIAQDLFRHQQLTETPLYLLKVLTVTAPYLHQVVEPMADVAGAAIPLEEVTLNVAVMVPEDLHRLKATLVAVDSRLR